MKTFFALVLALFLTSQTAWAELPLEGLLNSSAGRFLFEQTMPGAELVERVTGPSVGLLEGHVRLERALRNPELGPLSDELRVRVNRMRERFDERFPDRTRSVFEGNGPLAPAEIESLKALAGLELQAWNFQFLPNAAENGLIYTNARGAFLSDGPALRSVSLTSDLGVVETLSPDSEVFRFHVARVNALAEWNDFPQVSPDHLSSIVPFAAGGLGNKGMFRANLGADPDGANQVIIKISSTVNRKRDQLLNEARMYMILNKLGLGPRFHGLIRFESGDYGLVTDFVKGTAFPPAKGNSVPASFPLQASHFEEILKAGRIMQAAGFHYTPDLQFILTPEGHSVLIDPEFLAFEKPVVPPVNLPYDPIRNTNAYASALRRELTLRTARAAAVPALPPSGAGDQDLPPEFRGIQVPIIGQ